jgi:hypothetical protein
MNRAESALQIWQILISAAHNRQTLTYEMLGEMINLPHYSLGHPLDRVQNHCRSNDLPPLTSLVVSKDTGRPAGGYEPVIDDNADRESVFAFDWYKERPRQVADFDE